MAVYKNYSVEQRDNGLHGKSFFFTSDCGKCWYETMHELDNIDNRLVVCHEPKSGHVYWATKGPVAGVYAPWGGCTVEVLYNQEIPEGATRLLFIDGVLSRYVRPEPTQRSKDDILRDLDTLREELLAHKE